MQNIWIFQFDKTLSPEAAAAFETNLKAALAEWKAHQQPVASAAEVREGRFAVVQALSATSGCGIDAMQAAVRDIAAAAGVGFDAPTTIAYRAPEGGVTAADMNELLAAVASGALSPGTIIFDNTVVHGGGLEGWEKPLAESWLAARLPA